MERSAREAIIRRLEFARVELLDLKDQVELDYARFSSDRTARRNVERMIENICNSLADVGKIIISQHDTEMPESYRDMFLKLRGVGVAEADLLESMARLVRLRNILAHQYLDVRWDSVRAFLSKDHLDAESFIGAVERWLARSSGTENGV